MLNAVAQFGILLLLLLTGMEIDLKLVRQTGRAALFASLAGIVVPFLCGVGLGEALPDWMLPDPDKRLITSLFLGTALSIASVKIVATVIREMNFMRRTVGQVILASAIIDDTVGWMITAVIFSLALEGHIDAWSVGKSVIGTLVFMGLSFTIGRRLVFTIIRWVNDTFVSDFAVITAILAIMILMAITTDLIGVHTVLGAFVAGILDRRIPDPDQTYRRAIARADRRLLHAGVLRQRRPARRPHHPEGSGPARAHRRAGPIASLGKFAGAFAGGTLAGLSPRESFALGTGMNARGSTEVIVATIGLSMGALSENLFTMIVAMAMITTMAMPPTLRWALARLPTAQAGEAAARARGNGGQGLRAQAGAAAAGGRRQRQRQVRRAPGRADRRLGRHADHRDEHRQRPQDRQGRGRSRQGEGGGSGRNREGIRRPSRQGRAGAEVGRKSRPSKSST